jgi:hypothetical protein
MLTGMTVRANEAEPNESLQFNRAEAYRYLRRGDQARDRRDWVDTVHAYQTALDMYRVLGRRAEGWEQDYFQFRIAYCERELEMVTTQSGRSVADWLAESGEVSPTEAERYRTLYLSLLEENRRLQAHIQILEDELDIFMELEEIDQSRQERQETETE